MQAKGASRRQAEPRCRLNALPPLSRIVPCRRIARRLARAASVVPACDADRPVL